MGGVHENETKVPNGKLILWDALAEDATPGKLLLMKAKSGDEGSCLPLFKPVFDFYPVVLCSLRSRQEKCGCKH